ncbi:Signal-transduction histidine kinase senX3 [compost metagenome]
MSRLINQLLSTARADSAPGLNQADIGRAVRIAVESLRSSLPCDAVRMRLPEGVVAVQGDENLIVEQMINLLDNASRYGAPPLIVHVARREGQVRITVWDHGPGVDDAELPRLPERFFRSRTAPRATGSGLGLSIVASMAKAQGAEFRLANRARRPGLVATLTYRSA